MPLGSARLTLFAKPTVAVEAEVIRKKIGVSALGNAQVDTAQSKFGGASALFDGTGDYLDTAEPVVPSSVGFTTECWIRIATTGTRKEIFNQYAVAQDGRFLMFVDTDDKVKAFIGGTNGTSLATTSTLSTGTWYHVAFVTTTGGNAYLFLDGTQEASDTGVTQGAYQGDNLSIGEEFDTASGFFNGHIDEVRISNTARYTSGFTPSTTPFTNDDNTLLLLHMNGTDGSTFFEDDNGVGRSAVSVVGNGSIQIDTAQSYFGGSSCLAPGSADSLLFDGSVIPLSGDFTIESWVRFTGTNSRKMLYSQYTSGTGRTSMEIDTDEKAKFFCASQGSFQEADRIIGDSALSVDTWYHIAVVRDGSTFTMYIDGVAQADTISHSVDVQDQDFEIFGDDFGTHTDDVHQDEFRVSNTARYTTGFTAPTEQFQNDANTLLLLHMDGTDGSTVFIDDNGKQA